MAVLEGVTPTTTGWILAVLYLKLLAASYVFGSSTVRLVDGPTPYSGRVEVFMDEKWGTICHSQWNEADASVTCKELGYSMGGKAVMNAAFGEGSTDQPIHMAYVECTGNETSLIGCPHSGARFCEHYEDAGVVCVTPDAIATTGKTRLANGPTNTSGRVEVMFNGVWGTVCRDGWTIEESRTVCKDQGFCGGHSVKHSEGSFGYGSGPVWLTDVTCSGHEGTFAECGHPGWGENSCEHYSDVGVVCDYCPTGSLRLVGGSTNMSGIVTISNSGVWGTVCDEDSMSWTDDEARVVCRSLGWADGFAVDTDNFTAVVDGPIWLSQVECTGWEDRLVDCKHDGSAGWGENDCRHYQDVAVQCSTTASYTMKETSPTTVPPASGSTEKQKSSTEPPVSKSNTTLIIVIVSVVVGAIVIVIVVVAVVCGVTRVKTTTAQNQNNILLTRRVESNNYMIASDVNGAEGGTCAIELDTMHSDSAKKLSRLDSGVYQEIEDKSNLPNSYDPRRYTQGKNPQARVAMSEVADSPARSGHTAEPLPAVPDVAGSEDDVFIVSSRTPDSQKGSQASTAHGATVPDGGLMPEHFSRVPDNSEDDYLMPVKTKH